MAPPITTMAATVLSYPRAMPSMMFVAWPVVQAFVSDFTGACAVCV